MEAKHIRKALSSQRVQITPVLQTHKAQSIILIRVYCSVLMGRALKPFLLRAVGLWELIRRNLIRRDKAAIKAARRTIVRATLSASSKNLSKLPKTTCADSRARLNYSPLFSAISTRVTTVRRSCYASSSCFLRKHGRTEN